MQAVIELVSEELYQCEHEGCPETHELTERRWYDEDRDPYYNILCPRHRAEEQNVSRCCGEEIVADFCNECGGYAA